MSNNYSCIIIILLYEDVDRSKLAETSELHAKRDKLLYEEEHIRRNQETNFRKIF
jgi:hypothetical protein